jgi:hypothetical protein
MRKFIPATLSLLLALTVGLHAAAGIFDSFGIVRTTTNTYYDIGAVTANPNFQGANLGTFDVTTDNLQLGGQTKTFKNSGTDVTGARIWYRIWSGTESGSFTSRSYNFQLNLVTPGDQQWGTDVAGSNLTAVYTSNLLTGLSNGNYTLEVYTEISTNGVNASPTIASNNSGNNFEATFTVIPEPSTYALLAGGLVGLMMLRRRAK